MTTNPEQYYLFLICKNCSLYIDTHSYLFDFPTGKGGRYSDSFTYSDSGQLEIIQGNYFEYVTIQ